MSDTELLLYNTLKQILEELRKLNSNLSSVEEELGNIKRRM